LPKASPFPRVRNLKRDLVGNVDRLTIADFLIRDIMRKKPLLEDDVSVWYDINII